MAKKLEVTNEKACIGCDLCVLFASNLINKKLSITNSPIDVKKIKSGYKVTIDPGVDIPIKKIVNICPTGVFSEVEDQE